MATLQYGKAAPGRVYRDRRAAFGVALRDGAIAAVKVSKPGHAPWHDLPGGGVEAGESEPQAVKREFGEETGLVIEVGEPIARADQFMINTDGDAYNIRAAVYEATVVGEAPDLKVEADHELVWLSPDEAVRLLRHDAHAWAVAAWLRAAARRSPGRGERDAHG